MVKNHRINLNDDTKQVTETVEEDARIITEIMIEIGDKKDDDSLVKKLQNIFARVIPHSHSHQSRHFHVTYCRENKT